jgi:hypothetical protein
MSSIINYLLFVFALFCTCGYLQEGMFESSFRLLYIIGNSSCGSLVGWLRSSMGWLGWLGWLWWLGRLGSVFPFYFIVNNRNYYRFRSRLGWMGRMGLVFSFYLIMNDSIYYWFRLLWINHKNPSNQSILKDFRNKSNLFSILVWRCINLFVLCNRNFLSCTHMN